MYVSIFTEFEKLTPQTTTQTAGESHPYLCSVYKSAQITKSFLFVKLRVLYHVLVNSRTILRKCKERTLR